MFKAQCGSCCVLRCSRLNAALVANEKNAAKTKIFRSNVRVFLARLSYFNF